VGAELASGDGGPACCPPIRVRCDIGTGAGTGAGAGDWPCGNWPGGIGSLDGTDGWGAIPGWAGSVG
jgi:hypothetical protein